MRYTIYSKTVFGTFRVETFSWNRKEKVWEGSKGTRALHLSSIRDGGKYQLVRIPAKGM